MNTLLGKNMRIRVYLLLATLALMTLTSCMPSSMILMAARSEYDILNKDSTRAKVEKKLGAPASEVSVPPIALSAFKFQERRSRENYRERNFLYGAEGSGGLDPKENHVIVTHCRYVVMGKIVPHGYVGDANAMGLMTLGVGELISIPMAIAQIAPDSSVENTFDVWYSNDGRPLAYTWHWVAKQDEPNEAPEPTLRNGT